jgi:hypothetical protein
MHIGARAGAFLWQRTTDCGPLRNRLAGASAPFWSALPRPPPRPGKPGPRGIWGRDRDCDSWPVRAFRGDRGFNLRGLMADQPKAGPGTREGRLAAFERRLQENRFAAMRRARELVRRPIQLSPTKSAGEPQPSDFRDKSAP